MDRGRPQIEKEKHSFSFQDFFKLINPPIVKSS